MFSGSLELISVDDDGIHQRVSEAALRGLQAGSRELEEATALISGDALDCSQAPRNGAGEQAGRPNDDRRVGIR